MWHGPITLGAHEDHDEYTLEDIYEDIEREGVTPGLTAEHIHALYTTNPLYEVIFDFWINPETQEYYITKVDFGEDGGPPFERPAPDENTTGTPIFTWDDVVIS